MIKAKITRGDGSTLVVLGLSRLNLERLQEGRPIMFPLREAGIALDGDLGIMFGETEEAIGLELAALAAARGN